MSVDLLAILNNIRETNVTKTTHKTVYSAVSPTRSELNQAGKTILITGGGTNTGLAIAHSFVRASAFRVVIVGRRAEVLEVAKSKLEVEVKLMGSSTEIIARVCDIVKTTDVDALWKYLDDEDITVDVFVSNAAKFTEPEPMFKLGFNEVWSQMEANLKAPMYFAEKFYKQNEGKQKVSDISNPS